MKNYLLGLDLGTTSCKAILFDYKGRIQSQARSSYTTYCPGPFIAEQKPQQWWDRICKVTKEVIKKAGIRPQAITGVGVSGQTCCQVLVDEQGEVLRNAITYQDRRAIKEAQWLKKRISRKDRVKYLGTDLPVDASFAPARIIWLRKNEAELFEKTHKILQPKDFINYKLTGTMATDTISAKDIIHLGKGTYDKKYLAILGIAEQLLPKAYAPFDIIGSISSKAAKETGLAKDTPVVTGWVDVWCNIIGSGTVYPGLALDISGTSEVINVLTEKKYRGISRLKHFDLMPGVYLINGPTQAGGDCLKWYKENIMLNPRLSYKVMEKWAQSVPPGAEGLVFLPYLQGERAPLWDSKARGAFIGVTKYHTSRHFVRAVYEGIAYSVNHIIELAAQIGNTRIKELRICGGGAESKLWSQIKADVTGKPIAIPEITEAGALGSAMLAGIGIGVFKDYKDAAKKLVRITETIKPDMDNHNSYNKQFEIYKKLYPLLKKTFHQLTDIVS